MQCLGPRQRSVVSSTRAGIRAPPSRMPSTCAAGRSPRRAAVLPCSSSITDRGQQCASNASKSPASSPSPIGPSLPSTRASPPSSVRTVAARATSPTPSPGCSASRARRACAARRWKTSSSAAATRASPRRDRRSAPAPRRTAGAADGARHSAAGDRRASLREIRQCARRRRGRQRPRARQRARHDGTRDHTSLEEIAPRSRATSRSRGGCIGRARAST